MSEGSNISQKIFSTKQHEKLINSYTLPFLMLKDSLDWNPDLSFYFIKISLNSHNKEEQQGRHQLLSDPSCYTTFSKYPGPWLNLQPNKDYHKPGPRNVYN